MLQTDAETMREMEMSKKTGVEGRGGLGCEKVREWIGVELPFLCLSWIPFQELTSLLECPPVASLTSSRVAPEVCRQS